MPKPWNMVMIIAVVAGLIALVELFIFTVIRRAVERIRTRWYLPPLAWSMLFSGFGIMGIGVVLLVAAVPSAFPADVASSIYDDRIGVVLLRLGLVAIAVGTIALAAWLGFGINLHNRRLDRQVPLGVFFGHGPIRAVLVLVAVGMTALAVGSAPASILGHWWITLVVAIPFTITITCIAVLIAQPNADR